MQVVDILGDHMHIEFFFEFGNGIMGRVGFTFHELFPALIVKPEYQLHIGGPCFGCGHVFNPVVIPQAIIIAKGLQSAFCADPGAGQYHDPFCHQ